MTSLAGKQAARAAVRTRRQQRSDEEQQRLSQQLARNALSLLPTRPATVSLYRSLPGEPGTTHLLVALFDAGHRVLLPRIVGRDLEWVVTGPHSEFARGPLGIAEPMGPALPADPAPLQSADVLFLPGLGVDQSGHRLGQGGGYYDRSLADITPNSEGGPLRVALLFEDEFLPTVPYEEHDCLVDAVATPDRLHVIGV